MVTALLGAGKRTLRQDEEEGGSRSSAAEGQFSELMKRRD